MINFIPTAFAGDEDTCPVCVARLELESVLNKIQSALSVIDWSGEGNKAGALSQLHRLFGDMRCDYRVAFAVNMSIWFSAERYGRAKKVPDLLLAYDEYRDQSRASFSAFEKDAPALIQILSEAELAEAVTHLSPAIAAFFKEVDSWTDSRRKSAFNVL